MLPPNGARVTEATHLGALLHGQSRLVVDTRLVQRHVDAVAVVVTEGRQVEHAPPAVVRDVDAVVLVVRHVARVHLDVACHIHPCTCYVQVSPSSRSRVTSPRRQSGHLANF